MERSARSNDVCYFRRGALGCNLPSREIGITANHMIKLPGTGQVCRASEALARRCVPTRGARSSTVRTVHHLEADE